MKFKIMLIGIALLLALCISPVTAVSGDDFEVVIDKSGDINTYTYFNKNNPDEEYGVLLALSPNLSLVTTVITPVMGSGPSMYLPPNIHAVIYLPCCFKEWQIKYYYTEGGVYTAYFKMTPDGPEWLSDDDD